MTYEELKNIMIDFGFEEDDYLQEAMTTSEFRSSVNQARRTITQYVPKIGRYDFTQDGTATGLHRIDLINGTENNPEGEIVPITYDGRYDKMEEMRIIKDGTSYPFNDYTVEQGSIVVLNYALAGNFTIFYAQGIDDITADTPDTFDLQMEYEVEHLVPLLAAYHAWLDDDVQKAVMYYNEYEQLLKDIMERRNAEKAKPKVRIVGGLKWQ